MPISHLMVANALKPQLAIALCISLVLLASCSDDRIFVCTTELTVRVESSRQTLRVGETTTARASATTCGGTRSVSYVWRYASSDSAVARVDSVTGVIQGVAPGSTTIRAEVDAFPRGFLPITVTP